VREAGQGRFRLVAERAGQPAEVIDFTDGATEAWLEPPPGDYTFRLQFVRNGEPQGVLASAEPVAVKVQAGRPD
jgi:hypothetical protein